MLDFHLQLKIVISFLRGQLINHDTQPTLHYIRSNPDHPQSFGRDESSFERQLPQSCKVYDAEALIILPSRLLVDHQELENRFLLPYKPSDILGLEADRRGSAFRYEFLNYSFSDQRLRGKNWIKPPHHRHRSPHSHSHPQNGWRPVYSLRTPAWSHRTGSSRRSSSFYCE